MLLGLAVDIPMHSTLTWHEAEQLLDACHRRVSGKVEMRIFAQRDRLAIGLMMAAGLRA